MVTMTIVTVSSAENEDVLHSSIENDNDDNNNSIVNRERRRII